MGASVDDIIRMFFKEYIWLVFIACIMPYLRQLHYGQMAARLRQPCKHSLVDNNRHNRHHNDNCNYYRFTPNYQSGEQQFCEVIKYDKDFHAYLINNKLRICLHIT